MSCNLTKSFSELLDKAEKFTIVPELGGILPELAVKLAVFGIMLEKLVPMAGEHNLVEELDVISTAGVNATLVDPVTGLAELDSVVVPGEISSSSILLSRSIILI